MVFSVSTLTVNTSGTFGINVIVMEVFDETSRNVTEIFYGYTIIHPSSLSLTSFQPSFKFINSSYMLDN